MKRTLVTLAILAALETAVQAQTTYQSIPPLVRYDGQLLQSNGTPYVDGLYTIKFTLYDAPTGGNIQWTQALSGIRLKSGNYSVLLKNFTNTTFAQNVWLEIKVGTNAPLTPRQQIVSHAYAFLAQNVVDGAIGASALQNSIITASKIAPGAIGRDHLNADIQSWFTNGNTGTDPLTHFLGTRDNVPMLVKVNNQQALRLEYATGSLQNQPLIGINVLAGYGGNAISSGVVGGTIGGGGFKNGAASQANRVTDHAATIGGGSGNQAGNNNADPSDAIGATVAGGIGGSATGAYSTIIGGQNGQASGKGATIVGGLNNVATGEVATTLGGSGNLAAGKGSVAAGQNAQALHNGSFVFADDTPGGFSSSGDNQFLIRALGGVNLARGTYLDTGFGIAGREANAGKIGYNLFTPDALDIVGAGTLQTGRKIKMWAESGLKIEGHLTLNNPNLYTGTGGELNRYLNVLNSAEYQSASGLKAGGVLVADDYGYANPNKNNLIVKGFVGIGTPSPITYLHVKANAQALSLEGGDHVYMGFYPRGVSAGRKAWLGFGDPNNSQLYMVNDSGNVILAGAAVESYPHAYFHNGISIFNGADLNLYAAGGSADSGDLVFKRGDGFEIGRIRSDPDSNMVVIQSGGVYIPGYTNFSLGYGYLNRRGNTGTASGTNAYSIYAEQRIAASEFNAHSDARIKNRIGRSDASADLLTLLGIEVTDYTMRDTIAHSSAPRKKVIAQQVEKVYPQAVSRTTGVVPDIYQNAEVRDGWVRLATNLKQGERVRLITQKDAVVYDVLAVNAQAFRVALPSGVTQAFVYGREVKDFRTVDYEALAMLNLSATQALYHRITRLEF